MSALLSPFPRRPIPAPGESIYGFERRFAACTRYARLGAFRQATGLQEMVPGSSPAKFARLAALAGLGAGDLEFMRWTGRNGVRRSSVAVVLGHLIRTTYLRTERLRFCPTCLAEDGLPEQRIHQQVWQIIHVCACPRHHTLLVEVCDDCGEPIEQALKTEPWSCACGRDMAEMASSPAPHGAIAMSQAIMSRLTDGGISAATVHALPAPFAGLSIDALLTVLSKLGNVASVPPEQDLCIEPKERPYAGAAINNDISCVEVARVMNAAFEVIQAWPHRANSLFSSLADRNLSPTTTHPVQAMFATRSGYRLLGRIRSVDGELIHLIDHALEDWLFQERGIYIDGRQRPKVAEHGVTAIDVADALRRLEGRKGNPTGISAWSDAGAVVMVGSKVSLSSVDATVNAIASLESANLEDGMSAEEWASRFLFNENYRRSQAIRDILTGKIRVQRDPTETRSGLASIKVSRTDFIQRMRDATASAQAFRQSAEQRAERARQKDAFYRSGKIYALLDELWPGRPVPDLADHARVRCITKSWKYPDREMRQRFYSVSDALDLMAKRAS